MSEVPLGTAPIDGVLPDAPEDYDRGYMNQLVRELEARFDRMTDFRFLKGNGMLLVNLPADGSGLAVNRVYEENGFLKVVRNSDTFAGPLALTTSLGTVTVTIT